MHNVFPKLWYPPRSLCDVTVLKNHILECFLVFVIDYFMFMYTELWFLSFSTVIVHNLL